MGKFTVVWPLLLALCLFPPSVVRAMGPRTYAPPPPKHAGLYVPWECSLITDHAPPLPEEADKLFKEARALEKSGKLSSGEEEEVFEGYEKAASMGHWKAINNLIACYMYGRGTEINYEKAWELAEQLIGMNVGLGYYAKYILLKKGWGIEYNSEQAAKNLHLAADYGEPHAQYELGIFYLYPERREIQGLKYLVCATRQGHGEAAYEIGIYLSMFENKRMAVEYFYRGVSLGYYMPALILSDIFYTKYDKTDYDHNFGFQISTPLLSKAFDEYYHLLKKHPGTRIPDLFKKHPLPENVLMTREQSRAMPSKLKGAFGGRWPDEIFPELAPDYLPPE